MSRLQNIIICAALTALCACGPGLYDLPGPPASHEWKSVSLDPAQEQRQAEQRYLASRQAALKLYQALNEEDWETVWSMLSSETQNFLNFSAPDKDGKASLSRGRLVLPDGSNFDFDALDLLMIKDMSRLEDQYEGMEEAETEGRKELFALSADGSVNKVVFIYETGAWRVHKTSAD
jgi:hypothetical protein